MNAFDSTVLLGLNQFAHRSPVFDRGMRLLSDLYLVKGEAFMAALCWAWHRSKKENERERSIVEATIFAAFTAIVLGRLLSHFLPYRVRPLLNPTLGFSAPVPLSDEGGRSWSAFPSDHAMLFSAMATGIWYLSRRAGAIAHAWWIFLIGFPRVYLGLHHPTDVIAGGLFGAGIAWAANMEGARLALHRALRPLREDRPGLFYALFFLVCFQVGTMFDEPRSILRSVGRLLHPAPAADAVAP